MRTLIILAALLGIGLAQPQGFFSGLASRITNTFNLRPPRHNRPFQPQQQSRPAFPQQPAFEPQTFRRPPQNTQQTNPQVTFGRPTFNQAPGVRPQGPIQHHHQNPQNVNQQRPPRQPNNNSGRFTQQPSFVSRPSSSSLQQSVKFTHGCAHTTPNLRRKDGSQYILTFLNGCSNFTSQQADDYCRANGGRAVSLDTTEKANFFHNKLAEHAQRYIWTGGHIDHKGGVVTWPSGAREGYVRGKRFWSYTGGSDPNKDVPQPDNRDGNEVCIAVLNNFYADGIKWHDVSCHHRKPTICEL